ASVRSCSGPECRGRTAWGSAQSDIMPDRAETEKPQGLLGHRDSRQGVSSVTRSSATRSNATRSLHLIFVQTHIELIDNRRPLGVFAHFLLEKQGLGRCPEWCIDQFDVRRQGMAGKKGLDILGG